MSDDVPSRTLSADEVKRLSADPFAIFRTPTERDPRVDPRPGDRINQSDMFHSRERCVMSVVDFGGFRRILAADSFDNLGVYTDRTWKLWAEGATVLHRGPDS